MSNFQAVCAFVGLVSFVLGIVFAFIDGMLLWSILFFSIAIILVLMKVAWNIAGFADKIIRKLDD